MHEKMKFKLFDVEFTPFNIENKRKTSIPEMFLAFLLTQDDFYMPKIESWIVYSEAKNISSQGVEENNKHKLIKSNGYELKEKIIAYYGAEIGIAADCLKMKNGGWILNQQYFTSDFEEFLEIEKIILNTESFHDLWKKEGSGYIERQYSRLETMQFIPSWNYKWCRNIRFRIKKCCEELLSYLFEFGDDDMRLKYSEKLLETRRDRSSLLKVIKIFIQHGRHSQVVGEITNAISKKIIDKEDQEFETILEESRKKMTQDKAVSVPKKQIYHIGRILDTDHEPINNQIKEIISDIDKESKNNLLEENSRQKTILSNILKSIQEARNSLENETSIEVRAANLISLAELLMTYWMIKGNWEAARKRMAKLIEISFCIPSTLDKVKLLRELGDAAGQYRNFPEARDYLYTALGTATEIREKSQRMLAEARIRTSLSGLYLHIALARIVDGLGYPDWHEASLPRPAATHC